MSSDPINIVTPQTTPPAGAVHDGGKVDAQRQQAKRLAEEFEAMLMSQMLRDMRKSMVSADDESGGGLGADTMSDTVDSELGRALSKAGGFGLSSVLMRAIERQLGATRAGGSATDATNVTAPGPAAAAPGLAPAPSGLAAAVSALAAVPAPAALLAPTSGIVPATELAAPVPAVIPVATTESAPEHETVPRHMPGPISSVYGWRRDPFTGASQFHKGVDVAMPYGTDVHAAETGRVVFSGVNGGYGNMVVVEHAGGQQTRYAHLSALNVQTGASVQGGQVIGRVGSSGHSTGPHLHFEVLDNGRAVDPLVPIKGLPTSAD